MLDLLTVVSKEDIRNDYYQIEPCGQFESHLADYYVALKKTKFEELCEELGAQSEKEKKDILNKINLGQIKTILLELTDSYTDTLTEGLCDKYGNEDKMLKHFNLVEDEPIIVEEEIIEEEFEDEIIEEEEFIDYKELEERVVIIEEPENQLVEKEEEYNEIKPNEILHETTHSPDKEVGKQEAILSKALEILAEQIGIDPHQLIEQAALAVEDEENPYLSEEEVMDTIEMFKCLDNMSDLEGELLLKAYRDGSVAEVTELMSIKLEKMGGICNG